MTEQQTYIGSAQRSEPLSCSNPLMSLKQHYLTIKSFDHLPAWFHYDSLTELMD